MGKNKIVPEIRDNYTQYLALITDRKNLNISPIILDGESNNAKYCVKKVLISHSTLEGNHEFVIESDRRDDKNFKFKLHTNSYNSPFFRYDSDGSAHRNNIDIIPLAEQQVTTPHFHKFNVDGIEIAYKTNELKINTVNYENINNAIMHFCDESNTRYNQNQYPLVEQHPNMLQFPAVEYDPLSGINF